MPFISNREYTELLDSKGKTDALQDQVDRFSRDAKLAESKVSELVRIAKVDKETSIREAVEKSTKEISENNLKLTIENKQLFARVNVVEKAFENLGFDVKDMKDILNKLVDGLVSKNTINVVK